VRAVDAMPAGIDGLMSVLKREKTFVKTAYVDNLWRNGWKPSDLGITTWSFTAGAPSLMYSFTQVMPNPPATTGVEDPGHVRLQQVGCNTAGYHKRQHPEFDLVMARTAFEPLNTMRLDQELEKVFNTANVQKLFTTGKAGGSIADALTMGQFRNRLWADTRLALKTKFSFLEGRLAAFETRFMVDTAPQGMGSA